MAGSSDFIRFAVTDGCCLYYADIKHKSVVFLLYLKYLLMNLFLDSLF